MRSILVLSAYLLAVAPGSASADCATYGLIPEVINTHHGSRTPANVPIDGAFVVATVPLPNGTLPAGTTDVSVQPGWQVRSAAATHALKIVTIAPGLSLYAMPSSSGVFTLEDPSADPHKRAFGSVTKTADKRALLPAPAVKKLRYELFRGMHRSENVIADLDGAVPAGAIAIVMTDDKGTARSFTRIVAGEPVRPFHSFDCTPLPNGTIGSKKGDKVKLFWVDDGGRMSAVSASLTIE